jgi:virulence factor
MYRVARDAFRVGEVQFCVAQKNRAGLEYRATLENAIHMIDMLRWFCGEADDVTAHAIASDRWQEEGIAALIRFDSGAIGTLIAARCAGEWEERLELYGGNKTARVLGPDTAHVIQDGRSVGSELRPRTLGWVNATQAVGFEGAVMHFLECVATRETPLTNGFEAARTQALLETILERADLPLADDPDRGWTSHAKP